MKKINVEEMHRFFEVTSTGELVWKINRGCGVKAGDTAGCKTSNGYRQVYVNHIPYYVHRIILTLSLGRDVGFVDHIDGNKENNEVANLRETTKAKNAKNRIGKGYSKTAAGWESSIMTDYKRKYLGLYESKEEAREAYLKAKAVFHPESFERLTQLTETEGIL